MHDAHGTLNTKGSTDAMVPDGCVVSSDDESRWSESFQTAPRNTPRGKCGKNNLVDKCNVFKDFLYLPQIKGSHLYTNGNTISLFNM